MKQYILIKNSTGEVMGSIVPHTDKLKDDGQVEGDVLYKHIPYTEDPAPYMDKYWDGSRFRNKPPQPGPQWKWSTDRWVRDAEALDEAFKKERNKRLRESDWTMLEDAPVDKGPWRAYRAALRGLSIGNAAALEHIPWPEKP